MKQGYYIPNVFYDKWFILFVNTVFFVLMAWLLPIHFEENDDVVMCMIANGKYSGIPDGHLVFIKALYGWLIAGLYRLTNVVEWYTLVFSVLHIFSVTGIVYMILKDQIHPLLKGSFIVFIYVMWSRIIVAFQFTTTAGLLCFSGCLALLRSSKKWRLLGIGAIFVASLIRFHAAALVGVLLVPLFVKEIMLDKKYMLWLSMVLMISIIGRKADSLFYRHDGWNEYMAYNAVRGKIYDNPNIGLAETNLPNGVTFEDYRLFCGFQGDPTIMTLPNLLEIEKEIRKNKTFQHAIGNLSQLQLYWIPILLLTFGFVFCFMQNISALCKALSMTAFLLFTIMLSYLGATASLKNRVFICMLFPMIFQMIVFCNYGIYKQGNAFFALIICLAMLGINAKYAYQIYKVVCSERIYTKELFNFGLPLINGYYGRLYPASLQLENISPFGIKDLPFREVGLGWTANIPFQKGILESHLDFVDSSIVYFGDNGNPPFHIVNSIKRNYNVNVELEKISHNERYALYTFKRVN